MNKAELYIQIRIAEYLTRNYPDVLFRSDLGGIRLRMGQAAQVKRLQGGRRAFPDMLVPIPRHGYHGLFGEVKKDAGEVYTKKGELRQNKHIREQAAVIEYLRAQGYKADFWCGFEHARKIIDEYLR